MEQLVATLVSSDKNFHQSFKEEQVTPIPTFMSNETQNGGAHRPNSPSFNQMKMTNGVTNGKKKSKEEGDEEEESSDAETSDVEEPPIEFAAITALTKLDSGHQNSETSNSGETEDGSVGNKRKRPSQEAREYMDPEEWKPINGKKRKKKKKNGETSQRKSKWLVAAVQVLTEESDKGIYAMGVSQIWSKIRDAGLMDFQGKTPRNSLSSALSAAKSKGANSVIVYSEGLYALRKYKHKLEEGKIKNNIIWEDSGEENGMTKSVNAQWVGASLYKKGNRTYYSAARINGVIYRVGEAAHFVSSPEERPYLGHIIAMFEDDNGSYVESLWYFFPEDTVSGRKEEHHKDEVFLGDCKDVNGIDSIESKAEVFNSSDFLKRAKQGSLLKNIYLCQAFYNFDQNEFKPLRQDEDLKAAVHSYCFESNGHLANGNSEEVKMKKKPHENGHSSQIQHEMLDSLEKAQQQIAVMKAENEELKEKLKMMGDIDSRTPSNWPGDVLYTSALIWDGFTFNLKQKVFGCMEDVELKKRSQDQDIFGLFAKRDIPKDTFIGEFTGHVQQHQNTDKRYHVIPLFSDHNLQLEINATNAGNETRYINDFRGNASNPNVKFFKLKCGGSLRMMVVSLREIKATEELLIDYEDTNIFEGQ